MLRLPSKVLFSLVLGSSLFAISCGPGDASTFLVTPDQNPLQPLKVVTLTSDLTGPEFDSATYTGTVGTSPITLTKTDAHHVTFPAPNTCGQHCLIQFEGDGNIFASTEVTILPFEVTTPVINLIEDPGFESGVTALVPSSAAVSIVQSPIQAIEGAASAVVSIPEWESAGWVLTTGGTVGVSYAVSAKVVVNDAPDGALMNMCANALYIGEAAYVGQCTPIVNTVGTVQDLTATFALDPTKQIGAIYLQFTQKGASSVSLTIDSMSAKLTFIKPPAGIPGTCATVGPLSGLPYCTYAANSPWSQPLPAIPLMVSDSQKMFDELFRNYEGKLFVDGNLGEFPHFFTSANDPTVKLKFTLPYGPSNLNGANVPMPANAVAASGVDGHLTVLNSTTGDEYDYYLFPHNQPIVSGSTISVGYGSFTNYKTTSGWGGTTTASGASLLGGLVTVDEFMSGTIHHALAVAPGCNDVAGSVYPATRSASFACPTGSGTGIPLGSRIWSDLTAEQVDALGLDPVSSMLLKAMNQYGGFVTDTNGWKAFDVRNLMVAPVIAQGAKWWAENSGYGPMMNFLPASFYTTHFHVLQACVTQGTCN